MRKAITVRADDRIKEITDISFPIIKKYAEKCNADFIILDHDSGCTHEQGRWHYRILKIGELVF